MDTKKRFYQLLECQHGVIYDDTNKIMPNDQMDVAKNFLNTQYKTDELLAKIYAKNKESVARYKDLAKYSRELEKRIIDLENKNQTQNTNSEETLYNINSLRTDTMKNYML